MDSAQSTNSRLLGLWARSVVRGSFTRLAAALFLCSAVSAPARAPDEPIPDGRQMKLRVLKSLRQSEDALEKYSCLVRDQSDDFNFDGSVKKHRSSVKEQFFVNQIEIDHTIEREGKPLSAADAKKEQDRVDREVKKFSNKEEAEKAQLKDEKQADMFLRALQLTGGRRNQRSGRSTLFYNLSGDPSFKPRKLEERFAQALTGTIAVDEETGTPLDVRFETMRDVRIGAGLLANLHKGFWLHLAQQRQPDGVWLTKEVQGSGEARAALFVHARFRFQEELEKCHLFSVTTQQSTSAPEPSNHRAESANR